LNLDHNLLELLPPGVRFLTALTFLSCASNKLLEVCTELGACVKICAELGACVELHQLDISHNLLVTLPHTIGNCSQLRKVSIQGNPIQVVPPSLSLASSLTVLSLDADPATNRFSSPPNPIPAQSTFNFLRYLREIYTYDNERRLYTPGYNLDFVPDLVIEAATSVTALNLDGNNIPALSSIIPRALNLDGNNITALPNAIDQFTLLQELLSICDNMISEIPASVGTLVRLQEVLTICDNMISEIMLCASVGALVRLQALRLSGNHLSAIPVELCGLEIPEPLAALTNLETFTFSDNLIKFVYPGFGLISSITQLALDNNPLLVPGPDTKDRPTAEVLDYLGRLMVVHFTGALSLASMNLTSITHQLVYSYGARIVDLRANRLHYLPDDFENMSSVQELLLDGNPMPNLPTTLGRCATLEILSVQKMLDPLQGLPASISGCEHLTVIRAAENDISYLPDCFASLSRVEFLDFNDNNLGTLPPSMLSCDKLKVLLLRNNMLKEMFKGTSNLYALHTLDVCNNKLKRLPRGLGSLVQYKALRNHDPSFNNPRPDSIKVLTNSIIVLTTSIKVLTNSIILLTNSIIVQYKALRNHDLSFNDWEMPPPEILLQGETAMLKYVGELWNSTQTDTLIIIEMKLTAMHPEIMELKNIAELNLNDNNISVISPAISKMHKLEELSMQRNRITVMCEELFECKNLSCMKFDDNQIRSIPKGIGKLKASLCWLGLERNFVVVFPPELSNMEFLEVFNVSRNGLEPDIRTVLDRGLDCLLAYMRKWSQV
ncbi:hypothetical protein T484DRAFT_1780637, partial [Baffinella frigidus]